MTLPSLLIHLSVFSTSLGEIGSGISLSWRSWTLGEVGSGFSHVLSPFVVVPCQLLSVLRKCFEGGVWNGLDFELVITRQS